LTALVLDLPRHHASSIEQEEEEDDMEEIAFQDPVDESQEVLTPSRKDKIKFGDNGNLIKASIVDVDCSI